MNLVNGSVSLTARGVAARVVGLVQSMAFQAFAFANRHVAPVLALALVFGFSAASKAAAFVSYDAATQEVSFAPGELVAKVINAAVGAITAGIPLLMIGMVFAYILKTLGWVGAKKK